MTIFVLRYGSTVSSLPPTTMASGLNNMQYSVLCCSIVFTLFSIFNGFAHNSLFNTSGYILLQLIVYWSLDDHWFISDIVLCVHVWHLWITFPEFFQFLHFASWEAVKVSLSTPDKMYYYYCKSRHRWRSSEMKVRHPVCWKSGKLSSWFVYFIFS